MMLSGDKLAFNKQWLIFLSCGREGNTENERSRISYDWLGSGFYFWEFNQARAWSFA